MLRAVAQSEGLDEAGPAVGVEGGGLACPADRDIDGSRIDGVGAVGFEVRHDPIARSSLRGMDGADPTGPDVAVGEVVHVEGLAAPVLARDDEAGLCRVDREHLGGMSVEAIGAVVVAGELDAVAGAELLGRLGEGLGMGGAPAGGLPVVGPHGYSIYQMPGSMNGASGNFEIGVTGDGIINHRFFRPGP